MPRQRTIPAVSRLALVLLIGLLAGTGPAARSPASDGVQVRGAMEPAAQTVPGPPANRPEQARPPAPEPAVDGTVDITYLGAGGLSIRRGPDHVLTAPFFSNPGLWRVLFGHIRPDPGRFPPHLDRLTRDVQAVLVGHAHYDHLMDLPLIARGLPESAVIYGSETVAHILAAAGNLPARVEALNARAGDATRAGAWLTVGAGRVRVMALRSGHAPHFLGIRAFDGVYTEDLARLPGRARGWKMGLPLSFVIDFLDPRTRAPLFRIYYQDTATEAPEGFPPPLDDGKGFDLAILCVASFSKVKDHPEAIVGALQPRSVVLAHWENFFQPLTEPPRPVIGTNPRRFIKRLERVLPDGSDYRMPDPGTSFSLPVRAP